MFNLQDPQAYDICPYNNSHQILRYRMSTHLVKCRKIYHGNSSMAVCLFNANHSVPTTELKYHLENCSDRFNLDKQVLVESDVEQSKFPIHNTDIRTEENWDDDDCTPYQPEDYCKKNVILRQAKVESAATRKNFRMVERQRMQELQEMGPSNADNESHKNKIEFRCTPLSGTAINVQEESPYSFEDKLRTLKPKESTFISQHDSKQQSGNCEYINVSEATATPFRPDLDSKPKEQGNV